MSDDNIDDDEEERRWIPPELQARLAAARWRISKKNSNEAYIFQAGPKHRADVVEDLKAAEIEYKFDIPVPSQGERNLVVKVKDLNALVPDWRDISYPEEVLREIANVNWQRPRSSMVDAYVSFADSDEFEKLKELLGRADIKFTVTESEKGAPPHVITARVEDLDEMAPEWRKTSVTEQLKEEILSAGWKFSAPTGYDSKPAKEAYITVMTPAELKALTDKLEMGKIHYLPTHNDTPCSVTVQAVDLDRLGTEWREAAILPEVKEAILNTKWRIEGENAVFESTYMSDITPLISHLRKAGIQYEHERGPGRKPTVTVSLEDLEKAIPKWRDIKEAKESEGAPDLVRKDANSRVCRGGRHWHEGEDPKQGKVKPAIMFCKDKEDAQALLELLTEANLRAHREGAEGKIVVTSADALRGLGIEVKKAENEVESEEQQQEGARKWLKTQVTWKMASESSPLARAFFTKGGDVSNALESLLALQCTKDLKRLSRDTLMKDNSGLMLEVNADALKAAVPGVTIAPFKRAHGTGREEDEQCTGR